MRKIVAVTTTVAMLLTGNSTEAEAGGRGRSDAAKWSLLCGYDQKCMRDLTALGTAMEQAGEAMEEAGAIAERHGRTTDHLSSHDTMDVPRGRSGWDPYDGRWKPVSQHRDRFGNR
jgi:hypothetical protein